jgi:hypothetical protein
VKTWHLLTALLLIPIPGSAQPLMRGDIGGSVGWLNAHKPDVDTYDHWYHASALMSAAGGWYWTEHLRTAIEAGFSTEGEIYSYEEVVIGNQELYTFSRHHFSTKRVTVGQQYQFLHNAWAHPYLGAGVDLTWDKEIREDDPLIRVDPTGLRTVRDAQTIGPTTSARARPFGEIGAKFYMSRRAFLRTDMRFVFRDGVDEVLLRFGVGVDF